MGYRDAREAAMVRVQALDEELAEARAHRNATAEQLATLQRSLERANAEILRLGGQPTAMPALERDVPVANRWFIGVVAAAAMVGVVATAIAGYRSETAGVETAHHAFPALGACLAAWLSRRRSTVACFGAAFLAVVVTFIATVVFFAKLWPSF